MNENQKRRWIKGRARWLEQNGPDMFPSGYWLHVATREWEEQHGEATPQAAGKD